MQDIPFQSVRDVILFGLPLILLLAMVFFRLDEQFAHRRKTSQPDTSGARRSRGSKIGCDPDGLPLEKISSKEDRERIFIP